LNNEDKSSIENIKRNETIHTFLLPEKETLIGLWRCFSDEEDEL
jgi:hypothetical protein